MKGRNLSHSLDLNLEFLNFVTLLNFFTVDCLYKKVAINSNSNKQATTTQPYDRTNDHLKKGAVLNREDLRSVVSVVYVA